MVKIKISKILYWTLFVFLIYLIIELGRKILGGSLSFEALVIALLTANLGYVFYLKDSISKIDSKITGHIGWHKGRKS